MKGIILAGGTGSRLFPLTKIVSKQLLPVYDKQMIFYPLETLRDSGVVEILFISDGKNIDRYKDLLGDGSELGVSLSYKIQERPEGLPQAFLLGEEFIGNDDVALILGDNIFSASFKETFSSFRGGARIFAKRVHDPERFGVVEFDTNNKVISLEEKPIKPKSNFAIPGLYIFDSRVVQFSKEISPSSRGELEIVDIQKKYLERGELEAYEMDGDWLDAGTFDALIEANIWARKRKESARKVFSEDDSVCIAVALAKKDFSFFRKVIDQIIKEKNVSHLVISYEISLHHNEVQEALRNYHGEVTLLRNEELFSLSSAFSQCLMYAHSLPVGHVLLLDGQTLPEGGSISRLLEIKKSFPEEKVTLICNRPNLPKFTELFYQKPLQIEGQAMSMFQGISFKKLIRFFSIVINKHSPLKKYQFMYMVPVESFSFVGAFLSIQAIREVPFPDNTIIHGADLEYSWRLRKKGHTIYLCHNPKLYDLNLKQVHEDSSLELFNKSTPLATVYHKISDMVFISRRNSEQNKVLLFLLVAIWVFFLSLLGLIKNGFSERSMRTCSSLIRGAVNGYKRKVDITI